MHSQEVEHTNLESHEPNPNMTDVVTLRENLEDEPLSGQSVRDTGSQDLPIQFRVEEHNDLQIELVKDNI